MNDINILLQFTYYFRIQVVFHQYDEFITCIHQNIHIAPSCWAHVRCPKCPKGIGYFKIVQLFFCSLMYAVCWIFISKNHRGAKSVAKKRKGMS